MHCIYVALLQQSKCFLRASSSFLFSSHYIYDTHYYFSQSKDLVCSVCVLLHPGGPAAFSPGNLSTSSSASSTLGSPDNDEYILSFETIDKMRRVSSYSSLNSLIGNSMSVVLQLFRASSKNTCCSSATCTASPILCITVCVDNDDYTCLCEDWENNLDDVIVIFVCLSLGSKLSIFKHKFIQTDTTTVSCVMKGVEPCIFWNLVHAWVLLFVC